MGLMQEAGGAAGKTQAPAMDEGAKDPSRYTDDSDSNVSPEEQAQYNQFEMNMLELIYVSGEQGSQPRPEIIQSLQASKEAPMEEPDPEGPQGEAGEEGQAPSQPGQAAGPSPHIVALASTAVEITKKLDDSAREAGQPLTDDVLLHGGTEVIEELATVAQMAGIHDYSDDELSGAVTTAMDMYREKAIADGRTDAETLKGQWGELIQADKDGTIDQMVPGIKQAG